MNAEKLKNEQKIIDIEVKKIAGQLNAEAVYDGIISPEHYLKASIKTAWILKEPHDDGGDYDYKEGIIDRLNRNDIGRNKYFDPMRYLEYSLNNNFKLWDEIPYSDENVAVSNLLLNTVFININKIVGGARVNYEVFPTYVSKFTDVVKRQLLIANPRVIIASGTIEFFERNGYLVNCSKHAKSYRHYYVSENRIVLDCYHLGQHTIKQKDLCDDIINALKDAKLKGFLK